MDRKCVGMFLAQNFAEERIDLFKHFRCFFQVAKLIISAGKIVQRIVMLFVKNFVDERIDLFKHFYGFFVIAKLIICRGKVIQRCQRIGMFLSQDFALECIDLFL